MKRSLMKTTIILLMALFVWGCAANGPIETIPAFTPHEFNANQYSSAVDNFLVILDASGSMAENYRGNNKLTIEKALVSRMNKTLPEMGQQCGLRFFGHDGNTSKASSLLCGMSTYSTDKFAKGLNKLKGAWGGSPLDVALNAAGHDFSSLSGTKALIVITDAKGMVTKSSKAIEAAKKLKAKFGSSLCIYPVLVGNDVKGTKFMKKLAEIGGCGFFSNADKLLTSTGMAKYVDDVFLSMKKQPVISMKQDSDHDGVDDSMDKCPNTPENVSVDKNGCPFDSDKDGVFDYKDKCPDTPIGAPVNSMGCWTIPNILFGFDKYQINSASLKNIDNSVAVLEKNPSIKIIIKGYTDNIGSKKYNEILSVKRAESVKRYFVNKGINAQRFKIEGFGFSNPFATNKTQQGRALNRRVELYPVR